METFFIILRKSLVAIMFVAVTLATTYVSSILLPTPEAHAGGNRATETTQILNNVELGLDVAANTISAAENIVTAFATKSNWLQQNIFDGVAWDAAKGMVQGMTTELVDWVATGDDGAPRFVSDFEGLLTDITDEVTDQYINNELINLVCEPFYPDVRQAMQKSAAESRRIARGNPIPPSPSKCDDPVFEANIETMLSGQPGSFTAAGGWDTWFAMVSEPEKYTPFGAEQASEVIMNTRIINTQDMELTKADWGDGFLSTEVCETLLDGDEICHITTPGKIIEEALSFNLDSGRQALMEADEVNEMIQGLFSNLANDAITGTNGLLGIAGGSFFSDPGIPLLDQINAFDTEDAQELKDLIEEDILVQTEMKNMASTLANELSTYRFKGTQTQKDLATQYYNDALEIQQNAQTNLNELTSLQTAVNATNLSGQTFAELNSQYSSLRTYKENEVRSTEQIWRNHMLAVDER